MSLDKLNDREFSLGVSGLPKLKNVAKKVNEIIDWLTGESGEGSKKEYIVKLYMADPNSDGSFVPAEDAVIKNTLGAITYTRADVGIYVINSDGLFTEDKTYYVTTIVAGCEYFANVEYTSTSALTVNAKLLDIMGGYIGSDSALEGALLKIEVYN